MDYNIQVVRKRIKNLYIRLYPANGSVRVSVPLRLPEEAVLKFIESKEDWIKKHLVKPIPTKIKTYEDGELHPLLGQKYPLKIVEAKKRQANFTEGFIVLSLRQGDGLPHKIALLDNYYKALLLKALPELARKWTEKMGVTVKLWRTRKMKSRWGSANPAKGIVCINIELMKKEPRFLEYIVVHELAHFFERGHNARFYACMDRFLPDWRVLRKQLNRF